MSAVLNSFDRNKESPQSNETLEGINRNTGIGYRKNRTESIRNVFNSDDDDDMEFEDSIIETPKQQFPRKDNISFSGTRLSSRNFTENEQSEFIVKNTVVKIPLKGGDEDMGPRKFSTPNLVNRMNRYGVRNGTPLKLPPVNSSSIQESAEVPTNQVEEFKEDTLIRSRKLISDDNKLSPGRIPTRKSSLSRLSPQKVNISPNRIRSNIIDDKHSSPPSNLKVKPLNVTTIQANNTVHTDLPNDVDIEFDSSDNENKDNNNEAIENRNGNNQNISGNKINIKDSNNDSYNHMTKMTDESNIQPLDTKFYPGQSNNGIAKANFYSNDSNSANPRSPLAKRESNQVSSPNIAIGDISRADLLERINNTINSIKEYEKNSSPIIPNQTTNKDFHGFQPTVINDYSSLSESPVELLDQLDSHLFNNKGPLKRKPDLDDAFLPDFDLNTEVLSVARPFTMNGSSSALKYAENITDEMNVENFNASIVDNHQEQQNIEQQNTEQQNTEQQNSSEQQDRTEQQNRNENHVIDDWPVYKWSKLMRIISLNKFSKKDIINNGFLRSSLGCLSKQEFQLRVEFLMEFKRQLDLSKLRKIRKRKFRLKMKYSKKSY